MKSMCSNMYTFRHNFTKLGAKDCGSKCFKHSSVKPQPKQVNKKYTETINLPKTQFSLWLKGFKRVNQDEFILKERGFASLYEWQRKHVEGPEFILHDGPPYANGVPHMGHAINKVLKDITTRHKLLQGYKVHYKPGWDCHGLPIELKAMAGIDVTNISPIDIRKKARAFAKEAIELQKAVFKSWGVMADWHEGCYFTYEKTYIQNQLRQFYTLYEKGLISRDLKPVYWSPSSRTALAEAELEYKSDHESLSVTLRLPLTSVPGSWNVSETPVYALIWTTTLWTLPANQAIAYNPSLHYCLISINNSKELYLVAKDLVEDLQSKLDKSIYVVKTIEGSLLQDARYKHPLDQNRVCSFLAASHVTAAKGTGLVHTAPAHGPDDFLLAKQCNLSINCFVDENGCYTSGVDGSLVGLPVLTTGSEQVLTMMQKNRSVVHKEIFKHSYPYDWRTKQPVIIRASQQWFIDTDSIKSKAVEVLKDVKIVPNRGTAGLVSQLERRPYWCISRQRVWGVPIPIVYNKNNNQPIISESLMNHYCCLLETVGEDFWWSCSLQELVPSSICSELQLNIEDLEKGQDILDIWFDSGLSWSSVLENVADVYLEGVDQFTGWFQSSLMTSVALRNIAPYRKVFVHGFAVDEQGHKMSKSIGNVVNPQDIIRGGNEKKNTAYGVDTLRWWVASHATQHSNVPISIPLLDLCGETVQKLRSVLRFLLGAIYDIESLDRQPQLRLLDRYLLHSLWHLNKEVMGMYEDFEYNKVTITLNNFITNQVSSLYCHVAKDRLYCEPKDSETRRAVQVTMQHILEVMVHLMAPILPVLAEEVYMNHPGKQGSELIFHQIGTRCKEEWNVPDDARIVDLALLVKTEVAKNIPLNCNNFEMKATVLAPLESYQTLKLLQKEEEESCSSELVEILQVTSVKLNHNDDVSSQFSVQVNSSNGTLCKRCRCRTSIDDELCSRCCQVLQSLT